MSELVFTSIKQLMTYVDVHLVKVNIILFFAFRFSLFVFRFSITGVLHVLTLKYLST